MRRIKITLLFLLVAKLGVAQFFDNSGFKIGLVYQFGQPSHRLGTVVGFYVNKNALQFSSSYRLFYAFRNYGPNIPSWEVQTEANIGLALGAHQPTQENADMLSAVSNFSDRQNMVSYGIKYYWDEIETKQLTGSIGFRIKDYFFISENDGFVFLPWDQYRTGAISFGKYFFSMQKNMAFRQERISIDALLYTGKTNGYLTENIMDSLYPARFGYKKMNNTRYAAVSHGILRLNYTVNVGLGQHAGINVGIDNEHVRNVIQNKFIHDLPFLPSNWIRIKKVHIPMRTVQGTDYLYQKGDTVRPGKIVWDVNLNAPFFY